MYLLSKVQGVGQIVLDRRSLLSQVLGTYRRLSCKPPKGVNYMNYINDIEFSKLDCSANCVLSSCTEGFEKYFPNNKNGGPKNGEPKPSNAEVKGNISHKLIMWANCLFYMTFNIIMLFSVSVLTQRPNQPMLRRPQVEVEVVEEEEKEAGGRMNPVGTAVSKRLNVV